MIVAYCVLATFILVIASAIWWVSKFHEPAFGLESSSNQMGVFIFFFAALPFTGLLFAIFSSWDKNARINYLCKLKEWREMNFFRIILRMIESGLLKETIPYYNSLPQGKLRDYLFAILITEFIKSNDPVLSEQGKDKLSKILEVNDPAKVEFK